jgi:hypothetical protein
MYDFIDGLYDDCFTMGEATVDFLPVQLLTMYLKYCRRLLHEPEAAREK